LAVKSVEELAARARRYAEELRLDIRYHPESGFGENRLPDSGEDIGKIRARATSALDFLRVYAGGESEWLKRAQAMYNDNEEHGSPANGAYQMGDVLVAWADSVDEGFTSIIGAEALARRAIVGTDLMEQVRVLNDDKGVTPAASMVLAGAALEVALRGAVEEARLTVTGAGSINSYSTALRAADLITKQDKKDIDAMAGLRNAAAHGEHEDLSRERAGMMEQQVNLLLSRLSPLLGD
jgi:hypothetical protein